MLYIIYQEDRPGARALREATRDAHLAYLEEHKDILVLGGGLLDEDGKTRLGSVLIINVPSRQAAEAFSASEPFRKAGLFGEVRITRMRRGQWNPDAAPKSAELPQSVKSRNRRNALTAANSIIIAAAKAKYCGSGTRNPMTVIG